MNNEIAINTYQSKLNLKNKINKQAEQKHTHIHREHFDSCQMGGGVGGMGEKEEEIKKYTLVVTK